jgi:uncharacterized protein
VSFDVGAEMRDGTVLRADVYRPAGGERWPTILVRTPYGKSAAETQAMVDPVKAARCGFLVIVQDTRGRFASDGEWDPFRSEFDDGFDSVEWAARLPGSNGNVGMLGESYSGFTQWAAASAGPQALRALAPATTWSDDRRGFYETGGAPELAVQAWWALYTGFDYLSRLGLPAEQEGERAFALIEEMDQLPERAVWALPDPERRLLDRHAIPGSADHAAASITGRYPEADLPSLNIGGWYDNFLQGTIDNFTEMSGRASDTRLLIGPWSHIAWLDPVGDVSFGLFAGRREIPHTAAGDLEEFTREYLRAHLDPDAEGVAPGSPVRYFTMGVNEWRDAETWPPPGVTAQRHFLHADGSLSVERPAVDGVALEFRYDPADPVPTRGGAFLISLGVKTGPVDQAEIEARDDVLVFTSGPLDQPLEVTGRVTAVLHVLSSADSTDWVVRLCDVLPDGRSLNVVEGIVRARDAAALQRIEVDLWSTSHVFRAGHRLRVDVTSSSFPRWDRNLNTGDQGSAEMRVARQTVYMDTERRSYVELSVMA